MKTIKSLTFYFLAMALMVASCKKDEKSNDSSPSSNGSFILDSKTYTSNYGYLQHYSNNFAITFTDASTVQGLIDQTRKIEMTFVIVPASGTLDNGTYSYDASHTSNLIEAFVRLKEGSDEVQWDCAQTGSITISKTNSVYDISYIFVAASNGIQKTITGSFKGSVTTVQ